MKFRHVNIMMLLLIGVSVTTSCEKFLDQNPDMRTEITTVEHVRQLLSTAYPNSDHLTFTEAASDNSEDKGNTTGNDNQPTFLAYLWEEIMITGQNTPTHYWNACYTAIAAANQALEAIETHNLLPAANVYKGEALIARAYAHHMLVSLFSEPYEIGGSNTAPGIPYVTKPETVVFGDYSRGTVASVYQQIEADLLAGFKLIPGGSYEVPKYHFTVPAAHAFAARFYLFKGEYQKVIDHVSAIYPDGNFVPNLRPLNGALNTAAFEQARRDFTRADKNYNLLLASSSSTFPSTIGTSRFGFGLKMQSYLNLPTVAGAAYRHRFGVYSAGNISANKHQSHFFVTNIASNIGFNYIVVPLFTVDEALMNRAEAYAHLGMNDLALKDINDFTSVRIVNYSPSTHAITFPKINSFYEVTDPKEGLLTTILDLKRNAFFNEGIRWFDILRHGLTVTHNLIDENGFEIFVDLEKDDPRRVFQLPEEAINNGLERNPRP